MCILPLSHVGNYILMFEVTPLSLQHINVSFEHPVDESIATGMSEEPCSCMP